MGSLQVFRLSVSPSGHGNVRLCKGFPWAYRGRDLPASSVRFCHDFADLPRSVLRAFRLSACRHRALSPCLTAPGHVLCRETSRRHRMPLLSRLSKGKDPAYLMTFACMPKLCASQLASTFRMEDQALSTTCAVWLGFRTLGVHVWLACRPCHCQCELCHLLCGNDMLSGVLGGRRCKGLH